MKVSIIIPVFNEEKTIATLLNQILNLKFPAKINREIIVINDGSLDKTEKIIDQFKTKIRIISHSENLGKGAAVRTGILESSGEILIIQDADLEYDPKYYQSLINPIINNHAQVVYGTRLLNYPLKFWGENKTVLPTHLIANKFLTFLTNLLYGSSLTDMETGYKVFKKEVLKKITIKSKRFDFEAEVTAKILKKGIKIVEIPIITKPRTYQEGKKIGWGDGVIAIWTLFKYRFRD